MTNITQYAGFSQRGLSPNLWRNPNRWAADSLIGRCSFFFEDFIGMTDLATTTLHGNWYGYAGTGCTIKAPTASDISEGECGIAQISLDGTAADNAGICLGETGGSYVISETAGLRFKMAFEARVKPSNVTDTVLNWFAGLIEPGQVDDNALTDTTGVVIDKDHLGFSVVAADNNSMNFVANKESGTQIVSAASVGATTAATWVKVGFVFDPESSSTKRIRFFVDGVEYTTEYITNSSTNGTSDTTNFPGGEEMTPAILANIGAGAAAATLDVDWIACGQYLGSDAS